MLNNIPHLPVSVFFDADRIANEIADLKYFDYRSGLSNDVNMELTGLDWKSVSLYSIDGTMQPDPKEQWEGEFIETELLESCPYTKEVIQQLGGGKLLARVEKVMPNSSVGWHSHVMEGKQPEWIVLFQLPIIMPENSKYSVVSYMDYRGSDYKKPFKVYEENYVPGQVYVLNSYHYHNAFNYGETSMIMVRIYADSRDPVVQEILQKSINIYSGNHIQSYEDYVSRIGLT
jgi:hypothetical protein